MGEIKDLSGSEGIKKIKEVAEDIKICMLCTNLAKQPFETRPMGTQEVDENGNIWFFSAMESFKNEELQNDNRIQLIYAQPGKAEFLSVYGTAKIIKDREKTDELYNVFVKSWFKDGKDDPSLTLIKVTPEQGHYWQTKDGKIVSLVKIAISAFTKKSMDGGIEGEIGAINKAS